MVLSAPATFAVHIATEGKGFGLLTPVAAGILLSALIFIAFPARRTTKASV
jgi:hypothetical protein